MERYTHEGICICTRRRHAHKRDTHTKEHTYEETYMEQYTHDGTYTWKTYKGGDIHTKEHALVGDIEGQKKTRARKDIHMKNHTHKETYTRSDVHME